MVSSVASGNGRHGINVIRASRDFLIEDNQALDNGFSESQGNGIAIHSDPASLVTLVTVADNVASGNAKNGIYFKEDENCVASGNTVSNNGGFGIFFNKNTDSSAIGNTATETDSKCFKFEEAVNLSEQDNVCNDNPWTGATTPSDVLTDYIFVVASGSTMSKNANDIVCDGVNDHLKIQEAINLFNGLSGTVELSDGTFNLGQQIELKSNLVFIGQGIGQTILKTAANAGPYSKGSFTHSNYFSWNSERKRNKQRYTSRFYWRW